METRNFTAIIAGPDSPSGKVKFGERVSIIEDGGMLRVRCCLSVRPAARRRTVVCDAESKYDGADETHVLPHKRRVPPRPVSILKTATGQYVLCALALAGRCRGVRCWLGVGVVLGHDASSSVRAVICSVPSPKRTLDRRISFADMLGQDLTHVNYCENLHYSKQKKRWLFFS